MAKLQKINRTNGSHVYSVNIPLELIESLNWGKGDKLELKEVTVRDNTPCLAIFKSPEEKIMEVYNGSNNN